MADLEAPLQEERRRLLVGVQARDGRTVHLIDSHLTKRINSMVLERRFPHKIVT